MPTLFRVHTRTRAPCPYDGGAWVRAPQLPHTGIRAVTRQPSHGVCLDVGTRCPCPGTINGVDLVVNGMGCYCLNGFLDLWCKSEFVGKCEC